MSQPVAGTIIRRHYIDRSSSGAPLREKALAIRANTCGPATTFWERNDVHTPRAGARHYAIYMKQAIRPMYECRDDRTIFADQIRDPDTHEFAMPSGKIEIYSMAMAARPIATASAPCRRSRPGSRLRSRKTQ